MNNNKLSSGTYVFLVIIIVILLGCAFGFFCRTRQRKNNVERFDPVTRDANFDDPNWKNNRFFRYDNIGRLVPTDPVHVDADVLNTTLCEHDDLEKRFGNNVVSKKKQTINEGFIGGLFNVSKKKNNKQLEDEKKAAVRKASVLNIPPGYAKPTDYSPITPDVNQGTNRYSSQSQLENEIKNLEKQYQQSPANKDIEPMPQKSQQATVMPLAPTVDKTSLEKTVGLECRFLSNPKCDPQFPNFSGASIKSVSGMMSCNAPGEGKQEQAQAICSIAGGKVRSVYLLKKGKGYTSVPNVKLVGGNGAGCVLEANINSKKGELSEIKIVNNGKNYTETPEIEIDQPSLSDSCYMCCK